MIDKASMKLPRKKKKQVPKGHYCYKGTSDWKMFPDGVWGFSIKNCPFYKHVEGLEGHCSLLNTEIMDQVKDCSINNYK